MIRKDERLIIAPIGEFYEDVLRIDAWITAQSVASQGRSLLCAKLMQRLPEIRSRVEYLAKKRCMSADDLWIQILEGAAKLEPEETLNVETA